MKPCAHCKRMLPYSEFTRLKSSYDGFQKRCKPCTHDAYRKSYLRHVDRFKRRTALSQRRCVTRLRAEVISGYGSKCSCCGENNPKFLGIDHIDNDGNKHRKEMGGTMGVYKWLRDSGFPKDKFRLLCYNCNLSRQFYKECPHITDSLPMGYCIA